MMDCGKAKEYIDLYIDGRLNQKETEQLLLHTRSCSACQTELDAAIALKRSFDELPNIEPPAGLAASAIKKARKRKVPFYAYATAGVAVAAALIAVFASGVLGSRSVSDTANKAMDGGTSEAMVFDATMEDDAQSETEIVEESALMDAQADDSADCEAGAVGMDTTADDGNDYSASADEDNMDVAISGGTAYVSLKATEDFQPALEDFFETNELTPEYFSSDGVDQVSFFIEERYCEDVETLFQSYDIDFEGEFLPGAYLTIVFASE